MTMIALDPGAAALLDRLHGAGYAAYVVGGCVRDSLLGLVPHDWDLCTSAAPEQVIALFGEENCIPTGLQHGTVTIKAGGKLYETTTFRTEGVYSDGRHPDEVRFVPDVREDLARRDFTINAMACSAEEGLIDPFGGQADLRDGIVRAVGEAHQRFTEDALRILRLYRFAARFGFAIEETTGEAARRLCAHLDCVSVERITEEITRLLAAPKPGAWLEPAVMAVALPELAALWEDAAALKSARARLDALPAGAERVHLRLAALLLPLGEKGSSSALRRLRCSNALTDSVALLVRESALVPEDRPGLPLQARRLLGRLTCAQLEDLCVFCAALRPEQAGALAALQAEAASLVEGGACCRVSDLAVNGRDLMAAGIPAGPALRRVLETLLEQVITGAVPNEREALLASAREGCIS